jgi:hypothetical protein
MGKTSKLKLAAIERTMNNTVLNDTLSSIPRAITHIKEASQTLGFTMNCDDLTGNLLKTLATSKPGGRLLELGTGTGRRTLDTRNDFSIAKLNWATGIVICTKHLDF